jgi:hypothetical protein
VVVDRDRNPWWLRALVQLGPTAAIALFGVYVISTTIKDELQERHREHVEIEQRMDRLQHDMDAAGVQMSGFALKAQAQDDRIVVLLRELCLMTAKERGDRASVAICAGQ